MYCDYLLLKGFMNVSGINVPFQVMVIYFCSFVKLWGVTAKSQGGFKMKIKLEI